MCQQSVIPWLLNLNLSFKTLTAWSFSSQARKTWMAWFGYLLLCLSLFVGSGLELHWILVFSIGAGIKCCIWWKCISLNNIICVRMSVLLRETEWICRCFAVRTKLFEKWGNVCQFSVFFSTQSLLCCWGFRLDYRVGVTIWFWFGLGIRARCCLLICVLVLR